MLKIWKKKWVKAALLLCLTAALPACSKDSGQADAKIQTEGELSMESVIMRVGECPITYREALIYMYQIKERYEPGFGEAIWDFSPDGSKKFGEYAKEEVIDNLTQIKIIAQQAKKDGVTLEADELEEITGQAQDYLKGITKKDINKYGLTQELIEQIYQDNRLAEKMFDITTSVVSTDIPDEQASQITIQYITVLTKGTDRNGKKINLTKKKQKKEAWKRAKDLRLKAKKADDFGNFADANSDLERWELTYGRSDDFSVLSEESGLAQKVLDAGLTMKTGKIGNIIETNHGYYILYCVSDYDEEATRAKKESMIEEQQEQVFSEAYTKWSEGYHVEVGQKMWEQITFADI